MSPRVKLGMTITRPSPYDDRARRLDRGRPEQQKLERQGAKIMAGYREAASKAQTRLPRAIPSPRKRGQRA